MTSGSRYFANLRVLTTTPSKKSRVTRQPSLEHQNRCCGRTQSWTMNRQTSSTDHETQSEVASCATSSSRCYDNLRAQTTTRSQKLPPLEHQIHSYVHTRSQIMDMGSRCFDNLKALTTTLNQKLRVARHPAAGVSTIFEHWPRHPARNHELRVDRRWSIKTIAGASKPLQ